MIAKGRISMTKKRVKYVDMVKGLAIVGIAAYHIIAPDRKSVV